MAEINKPSDINKIWAAGGDIVTPADTKINNGWVEEIPPHEWENYLQNKQDLSIAHINQHGIALWDSVTEYQAGKSYVTGSDGIIYVCISTNVNNNPVTDLSQTYWVNYSANGYLLISSSQVWAVPKILSLGIKKPKVTVQAGGGSGALGINNVRGGGGGAGGTAIGVVDLTGITSVNVTVGIGAAAITSNLINGGSGGSSSFLTLNASGGAGGVRYTTSIAPSGGFGGSASGGTLNIRGGDGSDGTKLTLNGVDYDGGSADGGSSYFGGGRRGGSGPGTPSTTQAAPGSGGGGGTNVSARGSNGLVLIEW